MSLATWDEFDVQEYVGRCYGNRVLDVDRQLITGVIDAMRHLDLKPDSWQLAADVGAGPNLFPGMLLAPFVRRRAVGGGRLELIEPSRPNLVYLRDVVDGVGNSGVPTDIWSKFEDVMTEENALWAGSLQRLRDVADVKDGTIFALPPGKYDAISAYFVAESITGSPEDCRRAVENLVAAVKPGGFVMVGHMLGSRQWYAGRETLYPAVPLDVDDLREIYSEHLDQLRIVQPPLTAEVREDFQGAAVVVGRRRSGTDRPFTSYDIQKCLYDTDRVDYFRRAIEDVVKPGMIVVDGGSGTGVLGMLAARAGAAKVYCVELNSEYIPVIEENARNNGFSEVMYAIPGDASKVDLPEEVDVIISEVISGGLFYEPQVQIVGNLQRFLKPGGTAIPRSIDNRIELMDAQDELYGLKLTHDTRHHPLPGDRILSTAETYLALDFATAADPEVKSAVTVEATRTATANAVRIPYGLRFSDDVYGDRPTDFLLNPQIIFLGTPVDVVAGQRYLIEISYHAGESPLSARIEVSNKE